MKWSRSLSPLPRGGGSSFGASIHYISTNDAPSVSGIAGWETSFTGADTLFKLAGVIVGVAGAISEESVFRGYLISELERTHKSPFVQIVVSGVAFGVIHIGFDWIA